MAKSAKMKTTKAAGQVVGAARKAGGGARRGKPRFSRPLLKLSGEVLGGAAGYGFDRQVLTDLAERIREMTTHGITPALVLGGGNIFRGGRNQLPALRRHRGDAIGMLATVMNSVCVAEHLIAAGVPAEVYSALEMPKVCPTFDLDRARRDLENGTVVIFAAGLGEPFLTTDTVSALRAIEVGCDVLIKATKVDGVYDSDPAKNPKAKRFTEITYAEVLERSLGVMDLSAIALCRENRMPLLVCSLIERDAVLHACLGKPIGTRVFEK